MKCLNIIVFYDNFDEIVLYINEIVNMKSNNIDVVVVVNKDSKNQVKQVREVFEEDFRNRIRIIDFGENVGYLNALLYTIKKIEYKTYRYIILSNTDIHYNCNDFFDLLLKTEYNSRIGCIAPSVYASKAKSYSNPHYVTRIKKEKLIRLNHIFAHPILARFYLCLVKLKSSVKKKDEQDSRFVYSPHGCYMIFTNDFINDIYGCQYGVKLYSEESYIGEMLIKYGKKCFYDANLKVTHQESAVTGKLNYKNRFFEWRRSIDYILNTFYH